MVASIAPYMNMPAMSYACAGPSLSDNSSMPDFARMGHNMKSTPGLVKGMAEKHAWGQITLLVDDFKPADDHAQHLLSVMSEMEGINVDKIDATGRDFSSAEAVAEDFRNKKRRVIFLIGDEAFKRRVVCASRVVGANLGITWITEGKEPEGWLTVEDNALAGRCTAADMEESYQGAINIVGQEWSADEDTPLDCFKDETAKSFKDRVMAAFQDGFPAGDNSTMVDERFDVAAKAADGTCVLAFTIARLLGAGMTLEELRNLDSAGYSQFVTSMKSDTSFVGASGRVHFQGNDLPGAVVVRQRRANADEETMLAKPWLMQDVANDFGNGTVVFDLNGGLSTEAYQPAKEEVVEEFPFEVVQVLIVFLFICCPFCAGLVYVWYRFKQNRKSDENSKGRAAGTAAVDAKV